MMRQEPAAMRDFNPPLSGVGHSCHPRYPGMSGEPPRADIRPRPTARFLACIALPRLRRKIGADPRPFTPLPKRPRHHIRFHRVVARILFEERALLGHLQTVTH